MSILLLNDSKILKISTKENNEPFIDLKDQNKITFGPSPEIPNNKDYTKMRKTVYEKLLQAQESLPKGFKFCLYEAYRSLRLQKMLFDKRYKIVAGLHKNWSHEQIFTETTRLVAPVINLDGSQNIPPHSTGAAIDVYLIDDQNNLVNMGIRTDEWLQDTDGSLSLTDSKKISAEAKRNRKIMSKALSKVGFINYRGEYWHWSYGDRYWAYHSKQPNALYGSK